jgi:DNA-binding NarL/FixJ family response regulator
VASDPLNMPMKAPRILLVDDEVPARRLLARALTEDGIDVVGECGTAEGGAAAARDLRPEVVLMDLRLPDGSGIEATRRIKESRPYVQVLLLTAYDGELPSRSAHAVGAYAYLVKGCPVSLIRDMVTTAATRCRALRRAKAQAGGSGGTGRGDQPASG